MDENENVVRMICDCSSTVSNGENEHERQYVITVRTSDVEFLNSIEGLDGNDENNRVVFSLTDSEWSELTIAHNEYVTYIKKNEM